MVTPVSETEGAAGDLLAAALAYAERGWRVLPLHDVNGGCCSCASGARCTTRGKHPRLKKWQEQATTDPALIAGWWKGWPTANIGIATGRQSNLIVLDVDPRHGGDATLQELIAKHETLPDTCVVDTGGGGWHYYFGCRNGDRPVRSRTLGPGLELKADGSYVIAPPSRT